MNLSSGKGINGCPKRGSSFTHGARPVVEDVHRKRYIANGMQPPRNKSNWDPPPIGFDRTESGSRMPGVRQLHQFEGFFVSQLIKEQEDKYHGPFRSIAVGWKNQLLRRLDRARMRWNRASEFCSINVSED
jgi:hypothetical protein